MIDTHIPRSSLQAEVVNRLRREITEGHWLPGTRLQERILCERFGISRSPLREAFQVLASEALIDVLQNKGAIVTAPTPSVAIQNFELLRALELLGIRLACVHASDEQLAGIVAADNAMNEFAANGEMHNFFRLNNEVHRLIVLASNNAPLTDAHLLASRQLIRIQNLNGSIEHVASEGVGEHDDIIAALTCRDAAEASRLLEHHLGTVEDNLRRRLRVFAPEPAAPVV